MRCPCPLPAQSARRPQDIWRVGYTGLGAALSGFFKRCNDVLAESNAGGAHRRLRQATTHWLRHKLPPDARVWSVLPEGAETPLGHAPKFSTTGKYARTYRRKMHETVERSQPNSTPSAGVGRPQIARPTQRSQRPVPRWNTHKVGTYCEGVGRSVPPWNALFALPFPRSPFHDRAPPVD
jgi:hypothetical protein